MADQKLLDDLKAQVSQNTSAVAGARMALEGYVKTTSDLTQKLQDALTGDDTEAVQAAVDELKANNEALHAAAPEVANAVVANTPARV